MSASGGASGGTRAGASAGASWRQLHEQLAAALGGDEHEARLILGGAASQPWSFVAAHFEEPASPDAIAVAHRMVAGRHLGEPLQWVLGTWGFRTIEVAVDRRALVPRPETEIVVEVALGEIDRLVADRLVAAGQAPLVLDLGTGSGVIALSIAAERPTVEVVAVDKSREALELARENLRRVAAAHGESIARRVRFLEGEWYEPLEALGRRDPVEQSPRGALGVIVSNPPYVTEAEWHELDPVVRDHDPYEALVSGPAGTEAIETVLSGAPGWLRPGGAVVVELAPKRAEAGLAFAVACGYEDARILKDLAGRERVLVARLGG